VNVLLCAACGRRSTEPVRQLGEMPGYPGRDGLPGPDGRRHAPPSVPRGTYVLHPDDVVDLAFPPDAFRRGGCRGADALLVEAAT
jgi:hypothetical protein